MSVDLNCDMGESLGAYRIGLDDQVMEYITSANVACGWHAGDPLVMDKTVKMAVEYGVGIGAHPGYPDILGFGRRNMDCTADEIKAYVTYQIGALRAFCDANGAEMFHVKPHGNLYLTAVENKVVARAIAEAIVSVDPNLVYVALAGEKGKMMTEIGREVGLKVRYEVFPDRAYSPDGTLVPRRQPGAVIKDPVEVAKRSVMMAKQGKVIASNGSEIPLEPDTFCVHGDTPGAVDLVRTIREQLEAEGVSVKPMSKAN